MIGCDNVKHLTEVKTTNEKIFGPKYGQNMLYEKRPIRYQSRTTQFPEIYFLFLVYRWSKVFKINFVEI